LAGCAWTAGSDAAWLAVASIATGSGSSTVTYTVAGNTLAVARTGHITITGATGLVFSVTQAGFAAPAGAVGAAGALASPGATARIPVTLTLSSGLLDSLSFGLQVVPVGAAPPITTALSFTPDASMPSATVVDSGGGPSVVSVSWLDLTPAVSGTRRLGEVNVVIPATATAIQSYTLHVTGANGSSGTVSVTLSAGPDATLSLGASYLVGDGYYAPAAPDLNSDGDHDDAGEFGDGTLDNLDLIFALRAVVGIPGFVPLSCSDRFDTMDAYPADTVTTRGGDAALNNLDLIVTLRRVVSVDTSRPTRGPRGLACPVATPSLVARDEETAAALEFGEAQDGRVPVYLHLRSERGLVLAALSVGLGGADGKLRFTPAQGFDPTLADSGVAGALALAWLDGFTAPAGRTLLGWVEGAETAALVFHGADATSRQDGRSLKLLLGTRQ
jgi:hypothetical protein